MSEFEVNQKYDEIENKDLKFKNINEVKQMHQYSVRQKYKSGILRGLVALQRHYLLESNYGLSLYYSREAEDLAIKLNNYQMLTSIYLYRGDAFAELGVEDEAEKLLNISLKYDGRINNNIDKELERSAIYSVYAIVYANRKDNKSVVAYYQKALNVINAIPLDKMSELQRTKFFFLLIFHNMNMGNAYSLYYYPRQMEKAEHYFLKALSFSKSQPHCFEMVEINVYDSVAYFYLKKKDYLKSIEYSKKNLNIERIKKNPEIRLYAYENLKESYGAVNDVSMQNKYLKLYSHLSDSLAGIKKNFVILDSKRQYKESEFKIHNLEKYLLLSIIVAGNIILIIVIFFNRRNMILKRRYFLLINKLKESNKVNSTAVSMIENKVNENEISKINISSDREKFLLNKLSLFETSEKFLKKNLTISYMSHFLNSNPKYLSQLIHQHKGKNFCGYINHLRINYIIDKLYNNTVYREYKISYLAEECGYSSLQVFVNAFKKETGMTPYYFIKELKDENIK
nr:AraC family transcriptional regulator [Elizabethkingia sp. ASV34]